MDDHEDQAQQVFTVPHLRHALGGMSNAVFYAEVASGRLVTFRVGRRRYVSREAFVAYVRDREREQAERRIGSP